MITSGIGTDYLKKGIGIDKFGIGFLQDKIKSIN